MLRISFGRWQEDGTKIPFPSDRTFNLLTRCRSVSIGPVFAAVLVMLLRTKLPIEKREAFLILVFVISIVGMLILMLSMRVGTLSVLNLLALCVSWCAIASYMTVNGLRGRDLPLNAHAV